MGEANLAPTAGPWFFHSSQFGSVGDIEDTTEANGAQNGFLNKREKANLLDVDSIKSLFPQDTHEPRVLNRKTITTTEVISVDTRPRRKNDRAGRVRKRSVFEARRGRKRKLRISGKTPYKPRSSKKRPGPDAKLHYEKSLLSNNDVEADRESKEEESRMAATLGLTVQQMKNLDAAEETLEDDSTKYLEAFKKFDEDGSGDISPEELRKVLDSLEENLPEDEVDQIIKDADTDGDGTINYQEFVNMMKARKRLLAMTDMLTKLKGEDPAEEEDQIYDDDDDDLFTFTIHGAIALPPLKLPKASVSKRIARRRPRSGPKVAWSEARKTPHVLAIGNNATAEDLRRELNKAEKVVKKINAKVSKNVQWVQENCPVTSLRAQLYCKRWGMKKLQNIMKRLEYKEVIAAWGVWNTFVLNKRNQDQVDQYMKLKGSRRLTSLFANWKKKQTLAAWNTWFKIIEQQLKIEHEAACRQIQRAVRGFLGRMYGKKVLREMAAITIERVVRGFLGRVEAEKAREFKREWDAAVFIQQAYRGYEGRKLARTIAKAHHERRCATRIQSIFRGNRDRARVAILREGRRTKNASTDIQRVWRGHVAREITWAHQQAIAEYIAAIRIQTCFRGFYGRMAGLEEIETRMQLIAEEEAALKIQTCYRGKVSRQIVHNIRLNHAATMVQKRWRGHRDIAKFKLAKLEKEIRDRQEKAASTKIQCKFRQKQAKKLLEGKKEERDAALMIQRSRRGQLGRRKYLSKREAHNKRHREMLRRRRENAAALRIQTRWRAHRGKLAYHMKKQAKLQIEQEERAKAARKIQARHRGKLARKRVSHLKSEKEDVSRRQKEAEDESFAATKIQSMYRGKQERKKFSKRRDMSRRVSKRQSIADKAVQPGNVSELDEDGAAILIQRNIRGKQARNKQRQKHQGDASEALRKLEEEKTRREELEREAASIRIQNSVRIRQANRTVQSRKQELQKLKEDEIKMAENAKEEESAIVIQSQFRVLAARRNMESVKKQREEELQDAKDDEERAAIRRKQAAEMAAIRIQTGFRARRDRLLLDKMRKEFKEKQEAARAAAELAIREAAVIQIQSMFRMRRDRQRAQSIKERLEWEAKNKAEAIRQKAEAERRRIEEERLAALKLQSMVRGKNARKEVEEKRAKALTMKLKQKEREDKRREENIREEAALKIQCRFRTRQAKRAMRAKVEEHERKLEKLKAEGARKEELERLQEEQEKEFAAVKMQTLYRSKVAKLQVDTKRAERKKREEEERKLAEEQTRELAASKIQAVFRGKKERRRLEEEQKQIEQDRKKREEEALYGKNEDTAAADVGEWVEYWDDNSQAYYYFNTVTQEARWEDPRQGAQSGYDTAGTVTDYDTDNYDPNSQYYEGYYDEYGQWVDGGYADGGYTDAAEQQYFEAEFVDDDGDGVDDRAQMGYEGYDENGLKEWDEYWDESYQATYYYNNYTGETLWEPPPGYVKS